MEAGIFSTTRILSNKINKSEITSELRNLDYLTIFNLDLNLGNIKKKTDQELHSKNVSVLVQAKNCKFFLRILKSPESKNNFLREK